MSKKIWTLQTVMDAMVFSKRAEGKSEHTISDYRNSFNKFLMKVPGATPFSAIKKSRRSG